MVHLREDLSHSILSVHPIGHCSLESCVGLNTDQDSCVMFVYKHGWIKIVCAFLQCICLSAADQYDWFHETEMTIVAPKVLF